MLDALEAFVDEAERSDAHSVIMYSAMDAGFSAGADLRSLYSEISGGWNDDTRGRLAEFLDRIHSVFDRLDMLPQTVISVVHRVCFGGGFELALCGDIRVVEKTARFAFPELRLGIIPCFGGIPRLERDVGNAMVRDLLLTGRSIRGKKAVDVGLATHLVPSGEGLAAARAIAAQTGKFDANARMSCKRFMKQLPTARLAEEKRVALELFQSDVVIAALKRFVESDDVRPYLA
jgi:enoyl-CoA hydratase/carnithine racemase